MHISIGPALCAPCCQYRPAPVRDDASPLSPL